MVVLGISGRYRDAAAAVVVNGEIAAAAAEESFVRVPRIGYEHTDGFPYFAVDACLRRADVTVDDIDAVAAVDESPCGDGNDGGTALMSLAGALDREACHGELRQRLRQRPFHRVHPLVADAQQVAAASPFTDSIVLALSSESGGGAAFLSRDGRLDCLETIDETGSLVEAARQIAMGLGCRLSAPFDGLQQLARFGEPEFASCFAEAIGYRNNGLMVDHTNVAEILRRTANGTSLSDNGHLTIAVQTRRRALAASFQHRISDVVCQTVDRLRARTGIQAVGLGGGLFADCDMTSRLRDALGDAVYVAAVPEAVGRAIGGALASVQSVQGSRPPIRNLRFGPAYSEDQVKEALDNCRLDYVYEPRWDRILLRASRLLARGSTVAWFQGPMEFGPRPFNSRSILCDPSNRYAAENINRFVKQRSEDHALAISMSDVAAAECLGAAFESRFVALRAVVREEYRDRVRAVLDRKHAVLVHTVHQAEAPEFWQLLELHRQATGVPGLMNVPLSAPNEPVACTPRDAIRTTFSCAIDALVLGRFLLMKDYWLLRSDADR